ncbi:hypothetical protein A9Q78_02130 [Methylophaga sp. 41_12_T18]|nr:hypothetical protein A9Q78_02130 [Methylophaga sp. 41_12_T18]
MNNGLSASIQRLVIGLVAALVSSNVAAVSINFDYQFDTSGFFTNLNTGEAITERRQALDLAASYYEGFTDNLTTIQSHNSNTWSVSITNPGNISQQVTLVDETINQDTIKIFVGGSSSYPGVLGFAGTGSVSASGTAEFTNSVINRGQGSGDYGIWGGYAWFNAVHDWSFSTDANDLTSSSPDFLTTAIHEIGHILGFGTADSWFSNIENGFFTGSNSIASFGDAIPVDPFSSHWAEGTMSTVDGLVQETLMDPSTPYGTRQLLTELDYAGFADIGWQLTAVPLPASIWLFSLVIPLLRFRNVSLTNHRDKQ